MIEREIVDAYTVEAGGAEHWVVVTRNSDGTLHPYILPTMTFSTLAAEYGLDEGDIDTLLRVAMLQLHIPPEHVSGTAATDPAAAAGLTHRGRPVTLDNAATTAQARQAHLARIDYVETHLVRIIEPGQVPAVARGTAGGEQAVAAAERLAALKAAYRPDLDIIRARRAELVRALGREV